MAQGKWWISGLILIISLDAFARFPIVAKLTPTYDNYNRLTNFEVDGSIDGQQPLPFIVDTGTNITTILAPSAPRNLPKIPRGTATFHTLKGTSMTCPLVRIPNLVLGQRNAGFSEKNVVAAECKFTQNHAASDTFAGLTMIFDPNNKRLTLTDKPLGTDNTYELKLSGKAPHQLPLVNVNVGSVAIQDAVFDTASKGTSFSPSFIANHPTLFDAAENGATGTEFDVGLIPVKQYHLKQAIMIGPMHFPKGLLVASLNIPSNRSMVIGLDLITQAEWTLSYGNGRWTGKKYADGGTGNSVPAQSTGQ